VLIVHDGDAVGYGWNVSRARERGAAPPGRWRRRRRTRGHRRLDPEGCRACDVQRRGTRFAAASAAAARPVSSPWPWAAGRCDRAQHRSAIHLRECHRVVAGPEPPPRAVIYTAHWTIWARCRSAGHNIFNGATTMPPASPGCWPGPIFVRTKPVADRTIVFLALTGAEPGLLGPVLRRESDDSLRIRRPYSIWTHCTAAGHPGCERVRFREQRSGRVRARGRAIAGREISPNLRRNGECISVPIASVCEGRVPFCTCKAASMTAPAGPPGTGAARGLFRSPLPSAERSVHGGLDVRGALDDLTLYYEVGNRIARSRRFPRWYPTANSREPRTRAAP